MRTPPANVVTFDELDGFRIRQDLGALSVRVVRPRNVAADMWFSVRSFLGIDMQKLCSETEHARRESVRALQIDAQRVGADAVIGVRFRTGTTPRGGTQVTARGRAVLLEAIESRT